MKKIIPKDRKRNSMLISILAAFVFFFFFSAETGAQNREKAENQINLHVFYGQGCPHCASLASFLTEIEDKYLTLKIYFHEVYQNAEERQLFHDVSSRFGTEISGVPTTFIDNKAITGFSDEISVSLEDEIRRCLKQECGDPLEKVNSQNTEEIAGESSPSPEKKENIRKLTVPIVVGAAAVDAINPCAFAVLIILMTAALCIQGDCSIQNRKRALKFGLAFACSIYISYFLMGLGLFSALQATKLSHGFYIFVTVLAVFVGLMNIKDYFWYGKGFLMEIPLSWRPKMKKIIGSATSLLGAFLVGFAVSLFELPCTGGPYIVILGLLAKEMTRTSGIAYLLLYNLVFIMPLIILSIIIYRGISTAEKLEKIRQGKIRVLHLVAGIIMLAIAGIMVLSIIKGWV